MARQPKGTVKDSFEPPKARSSRKNGLPKALNEELASDEQQTPEEFAKEFFGGAEIVHSAVGQDGLPTLEWLGKTFQTKSARIRYLNHLGHTPKVIAKHLGIRYQMARNVCTTQLKRGPNEDWRPREAPTNDPQTIPGEDDDDNEH